MSNTFKPNDLTSLLHWYRSDFGISEVSGSVATMLDIVGGAHATENGINRPTYVENSVNGYPKIRFGRDLKPWDYQEPETTADSLDMPTGQLDQPFTIALIWQNYAWPGPGPSVDVTGLLSRRLVLSDVSASLRFMTNYDGTMELSAGEPLTSSAFNSSIVSCRESFGCTVLTFNGSGSSIHNNGFLMASGNVGTGSIESSLHVCGRDLDNLDQGYVDLVELCVFTGSLSTFDIMQMTNYAKDRYAL